MDSSSSRIFRLTSLAARMQRHSGMPVSDNTPYHSGTSNLALVRCMISNERVTGSFSYFQPLGVANTGTDYLRNTVPGLSCSAMRPDNGEFLLTVGAQRTCRTGQQKRSRPGHKVIPRFGYSKPHGTRSRGWILG